MTDKEKFNQSQESDFIKDLKFHCIMYGYELKHCYVEVSESGYERFEFYMTEKDYKSYTPEIYVRTTFGRKTKEMDKPKFEVQTTSYGALNEEEMKEFMNAMNDGWKFQQYLNNLDWSKCPRIKFDEE